jgi:C4-type Zn-finger protein
MSIWWCNTCRALAAFSPNCACPQCGAALQIAQVTSPLETVISTTTACSQCAVLQARVKELEDKLDDAYAEMLAAAERYDH